MKILAVFIFLISLFHSSFSQKDTIKVYSDAYKKYDELFNFSFDLDTTSFKERYKSLLYTRVHKIQNDELKQLSKISSCYKIKLIKGFNDEIWFKLKFKDIYPEMEVFNDLIWAYTGTKDKLDFTNSYVKNKIYLDIRLDYLNDKREFIVELKSFDKFYKINAYPRFKASGIDLEISKNLYDIRYPKYLKDLETIEINFEKELDKEKQTRIKSYNKQLENAWKSLSKLMSEEERKLTKSQWLIYYNKLLALIEKSINY